MQWNFLRMVILSQVVLAIRLLLGWGCPALLPIRIWRSDVRATSTWQESGIGSCQLFRRL